MEQLIAQWTQIYSAYRQELEECQRRQKPADGLFGIGHSIKDDACHDRFDTALAKAVEELAAAPASPEAAETVIRVMLMQESACPWPESAQWMLRAAERHILLLIPFLSADAAAALAKLYADRYRPWDRLPVQKEVCKALKEHSRGKI